MKKIIILVLTISCFSLVGCLSVLTSGFVAEGDTNKDKSLSYEEYFALQKTKESQLADAKQSGLSVEEYTKQEFKKMDENKNGLLTKKEILRFFKKGDLD